MKKEESFNRVSKDITSLFISFENAKNIKKVIVNTVIPTYHSENLN